MPSTLTPTIAPDTVISFRIKPGSLQQLLDAREERGPKLKCFEGGVTLVSPGGTHGWKSRRVHDLISMICVELGIEHTALGSTTWALPLGVGDTAYEADEAYYVQSHATAKPGQPPDLAIEVVVSHPETKALWAGAFLKIPELWVLDLPRDRLTFHHLATKGKFKGEYRSGPRSKAFPFLASRDVLERLNDPATGDTAFLQNCRAWVRRVLVPRRRPDLGGA
ncbi:MAG: Uma2 family endonuclease [Isosphaeraceae bacterium]